MGRSQSTAETVRVLYVDADQTDRELVRDALCGDDIQLSEAATQAEFQEKLAAGDFEVVLTDFNNLGFEGLDVLDIVRERFPQVPVVIVTGAGSEEVVLAAWRRGAADYVIKAPSHLCHLPKTIRSVLEKRQQEIQHRVDKQFLQESETRFRSLIENSFDVIVTFDRGGNPTYVSPSVKRVLGYEPAELISMQGLAIVHPDDVAHAGRFFAQGLAQPGQPMNATHRLRHKDGSYRTVEVNGVNLLEVPGVEAMVSNFRDITDRKQTEEALRRSEKAIRTLADNIPDSIVRLDRQHRSLFANKEFERVTGIPMEQYLGKTAQEIGIPKPLATKFRQATEKVFGTGQPVSLDFEYEGVDRRLWFEGRLLPEFGPDGDVHTVLAIDRDITTRKKAEEALRESESKLRSIMDASPDHIMLLDVDAKIQFINRTVPDLTVDRVIDTPIYDYVPSKFHNDVRDCFARVLSTGRPDQYEVDYLTSDGDVRLFEARVAPVTRDDEVVAFAVNAQDITSRKQSEDALRKSEARNRRILESSIGGIYIYDMERGRNVYVNPQYTALTGYTLDQINVMTAEQFFALFHPDDQPRIAAHIQCVRGELPDGHNLQIDYRIRTTSGDWVWCTSCDAVYERDESGIARRFIGTMIEITERKRAEERLHESESLFRCAFEDAATATALQNPDGTYLRVNNAFCQMLGKSEEELVGMSYRDVTHQDDLTLGARVDEQMADEAIRFHKGHEKRYLHKDGHDVWALVSAAFVRDGSGKPLYRVVQAQDITDRKRAEHALRQSEEQLRLITDNAPGLISYIDRDQRYRFVNPLYQKWFGKSPDEVIGRTVRQLVGSEAYSSFGDRIDRVLAGEEVRFENWFTSNGTKRFVNGVYVPHFGAAGEVVGFFALLIDTTDRKRMEDAIRESEDKFRTLAENSPVIVAIYRGTTMLYTNRVAEQFSGYSRQELLQMESVDIVHPEDRDMVLQRGLERQAGRSVPGRYEFRLLTKAGDVRWVDFSATVIDYGGQPAVLSTAIDITQRRRSEAAIRGLHVITSDAAATLDEKTERLLRLGCERFGLELAILGLVDGNRYRVNHIVAPDDFPIQRGADFELTQTLCGLALEADSPVAINDVGRTEWIDHPFYQATKIESYLGVPIHVEGQPIGTVSLCDRQPRGTPYDDADKDFAQLMARWIGYELERKQAEQTLRDSEAKLAHMSRVSTMGEMATALAHELSQPLGAAANYAGGCIGLVEAGNIRPDELLKPLRRLKDQINGSGDIIRRLRSFISKAAPNMCRFNLNDIAREVNTLLPAEGIYRKISRKLELESDLPHVWGDPLQIKQVLVNLVRNAVASVAEVRGSGGEVTIRSLVREKMLSVSVIDNGKGVSADQLNRVFEPYYTTKSGGMGMGLAICRTIIQNHGGQIWAEPTPEVGARFCFTLPLPVDAERAATYQAMNLEDSLVRSEGSL